MPAGYTSVFPQLSRDSLELASLASSSGLADDAASNTPSSRPSFSSSRKASTTGAGGYAPIGASEQARSQGGGLGGAALLEKHKTLTYLNGLSLVIGIVIGSGIFSSPAKSAPIYAELGGAIPLNGGAQVYLSKIFGEIAGFLFAWVAVLVLKPGSAAIIAIIMGEYLVRAVVGPDAETISPWVAKGVAVAGLLLVTFLNCVSTRLGTRINDMLMFLKFVALLGVTIIGIVVAATGFSSSGEASRDWKDHSWFDGTSSDPSSWALALYAGLWAYDGWDNTNYVLRAGQRGVLLVLPLEAINATNTVAVIFGAKVFGKVGALIFALIVSASCLGALNSSTFTSSRLIYAAGKEGYIPMWFSRIGLRQVDRHQLSTQRTRGWFMKRLHALIGDEEHGLFFTPIYSLLLNFLLTLAYVVAGEFSTLLTFYGVAGYTFYFITVLGLIVLRVREPKLERPYKTWITTPIVFCCVSLFLLSRAVFAQPLQTLIVVIFVVAGVPVYYWRIMGRDEVVNKRERRMRDLEGGDAPWWKFWKR
ncbi:unnamed protein product [Parascedosporium putredinis]|uniref:Amino acid transporter n=1 Tax=Parascedosporium putredinis TaxID=1442378 RepID=A0A9P1M6P8_9PEZI|nr:unnamed protein product [Parascedosporium putredinis]CAI7987371.1 unnamed protein product [Parascedosporium putredinis]